MKWKSAAVEDIGGRRRAASSNIGDCVSPYQTSRCAALRCSWVRVRIEGVCGWRELFKGIVAQSRSVLD